MIPTGEVRPVAGTDFDFRATRPIRKARDGAQVPYDHNFCLGRARVPLRTIAKAAGARSGVTMDVRSTEPGVQLYGGQKVNVPVAGLQGIRYGASSGFCLEAQVLARRGEPSGFPERGSAPGRDLQAGHGV